MQETIINVAGLKALKALTLSIQQLTHETALANNMGVAGSRPARDRLVQERRRFERRLDDLSTAFDKQIEELLKGMLDGNSNTPSSK